MTAGECDPDAAETPSASLARDAAHLGGLIDALHDRRRSQGTEDRASALLSGPVPFDGAERRLRAAGALLVTLDTYLRARRATAAARDAGDAGSPDAAVARQEPAAQSDTTPRGPGEDLAAAAARYIARDLAARRLTEFTSAEAYRLARALARIGGVAESVERSLTDANTIRLHPPPLQGAVSHSAG